MIDYAEMLLEHGVDPNINDLYGDTPIFKPILFDNLMGLKLLLSYKPDLWVLDKDGRTPMDLAKSLGKWEIYELLIEELANR